MLHIGVTVGNGAGIYPGIGSIFKENAMAGGIGNIYRAYRGTITAGNAEETASAVAGIDLGAGNIGAIAIGHAESSITTAVVVVASGYSAYRTVPRLVQQYGASTGVVTGYTSNVKTIEPVGFNGMGA